jgi:DNA replication and repair protein RecF
MSRPLRVSRLTLTDFRNYRDLRLDLESTLVILTGPNGAGKTNLLEAVSLLVPGRGLRNAVYEDIARENGSGGWAVAARLEGEGPPVRVSTAWSPAGSAEMAVGSRDIVIDGVRHKSSGALAWHLRAIWLTPAMDRLFAGRASERRRFLDRLVQTFDPAHGSRVLAFEKLMRDRHILLADERRDQAWISGVEDQMAEYAIAIAAGRRTAIEALSGYILKSGPAEPFPSATLELAGETEALLARMPAVNAEDEYRRVLADSRAIDAAAGRTSKGPHRSDLAVTHAPTGMAAARCSTGEQKALLIGLVLAHAAAVKEASGIAPVLLLDEVAAHLDGERRQALFGRLGGLGSQVWMTGTDEGLFRPLDAEFFNVEAGKMSASARV